MVQGVMENPKESLEQIYFGTGTYLKNSFDQLCKRAFFRKEFWVAEVALKINAYSKEYNFKNELAFFITWCADYLVKK